MIHGHDPKKTRRTPRPRAAIFVVVEYAENGELLDAYVTSELNPIVGLESEVFTVQSWAEGSEMVREVMGA